MQEYPPIEFPEDNDPYPGLPPDSSAAAERPVSVFEFTSRLKRFLEQQFESVFIEGEVSNLRPAASGHVYFVLKDSRATISCVLWAADAARLTRPLQDGETVEIRGRVSLYEPRGQYQVIVHSVRPAGLGRLFLAFQELKLRLEAEGLFDPERKRRIPRFPKSVGVVTSPSGAAIRDILQILARRAPHLWVFIWPVRVQGDGAAAEIAHAIAGMNKLAIADVLIAGRGGGSIEDLWPFNEEIVARAIASSRIPVISAVGHEIDFTIADFAADLRAPTPSAAAELVVCNTTEMIRELHHFRSRLNAAVRRQIEFLRGVSHLRARLDASVRPRIGLMRSHIQRFTDCHALKRPLQRVNEYRQRLDDVQPGLERRVRQRHRDATARLHRLQAQLSALDPRAILSRGYSITFHPESGAIVRKETDAAPGQALRVLLSEGRIDVNVAGAAAQPARARTRGRRQRPDPNLEWFGDRQPAGSPSEHSDAISAADRE